MTVWAVAWEWYGVRYVVDFDDEHDAQQFALALAESGRSAIVVLRSSLDVPEEAIAMAKERIAARLRAAGVEV